MGSWLATEHENVEPRPGGASLFEVLCNRAFDAVAGNFVCKHVRAAKCRLGGPHFIYGYLLEQSQRSGISDSTLPTIAAPAHAANLMVHEQRDQNDYGKGNPNQPK
jgi:hypothetical protein